MKNYLTILALGSLICFSACRGGTDQTPDEKASVDKVAPGTRNSPNVNDAGTDGTGATSTQMAYVCPMKCEGSASNQPGKCPVCGMDLVANSAKGANNTTPNHEQGGEESKGENDKMMNQPH